MCGARANLARRAKITRPRLSYPRALGSGMKEASGTRDDGAVAAARSYDSGIGLSAVRFDDRATGVVERVGDGLRRVEVAGDHGAVAQHHQLARGG